MAATLAASAGKDLPGGRGARCSCRNRALKASIMFSRSVAAVKYVSVTDSEMAGPLCTQCGAMGGMYTPRPGVRG